MGRKGGGERHRTPEPHNEGDIDRFFTRLSQTQRDPPLIQDGDGPDLRHTRGLTGSYFTALHITDENKTACQVPSRFRKRLGPLGLPIPRLAQILWWLGHGSLH